MNSKMKDKKGFTLVEISVVLVILAILAAIAVPSVLGYVEEAKKEKYIAEAKAIYTVIQVEEARLENEIDYTDKGDSYHNMEDMYKNFVIKQMVIQMEKILFLIKQVLKVWTGYILMILKMVMFIFYIGQVMMVKKYKQNFIRINKLRLHQLNNLNYYNFILRSL